MNKIIFNCQRWLTLTLAAFLATAAFGQGIVYVQAPPATNSLVLPPGAIYWPEDYLGARFGSGFPIVINGQTVFNLVGVYNNRYESAIVTTSNSGIIGQQPFQIDPNDVWVVPLAAGTFIGSSATGYGWFNSNNSYADELLAYSVDSGVVGEPPLTSGYFTGLESAYIGFDFIQGGQTYYGWIQVGCPDIGNWIYNYAYETTPNTPIFAGEGAPVPEPSTWVLLIMGGIGFFRRQWHFRLWSLSEK